MAAKVLHLQPKDSCSNFPRNKINKYVGTQLNYNDFYWNFMFANWPVVLTDISTDWKCRNWIQQTTLSNDNDLASTCINFDYLRRKINNCCVPIADCTSEYFNSHTKIEMPFYDFLDYWQSQINAEIAIENSNVGERSTTSKNLYLKDWHLKAQMPDYEFYQVPMHFASDWLNEQLVAAGRDDYRFVYMGPKNSWTPFHADVFGSYSWSTNISGCKKWILLPPGDELKLSDNLGNLPFSIDEEQLERKQVRFFTLLQRENEAVFVPSGWYHQVWNLTDTISVNHNWFNACNVQRIWCNLSANMRQVIAEIEDCRQMDNFDEHCQTMLRASFGINYLDFLDMLEFIAERRLSFCNNGNVDVAAAEMSSKLLFFDKYTPNDFHIRHDLQSIKTVLDFMLQDDIVCNNRAVLYRRCMRLLELIKGF